MSLNTYCTVLAVGVVFCFATSFYQVEGSSDPCPKGWFGPDCQYKCHCVDKDNACSSKDGSCLWGSGCQKGWFGPACQFSDLAASSKIESVPQTCESGLVLDGNDETCVYRPDLSEMTLTLDKAQPFSWLRLVSKRPVSSHDFAVQFKNENTSGAEKFSCRNARGASIDSKTVDIYCDLDVNVNVIILTGEGLQRLCSVYVSGGRNVALKANTSQSSTGWSGHSHRAVDGNTNRNYWAYSCTHSQGRTNNTLNVMLPRPQEVFRYVIHNRDGYKHRLHGFELESFDEDDHRVFHHVDDEARHKSVLTIIPEQKSLVSYVRISKDDHYLTLCEVEIFAETKCDNGTFGLGCTKTCNCEGTNQNCVSATGDCPSGCKAGFYGEGCATECSQKHYGVDCKERCSHACREQRCDPRDGTCYGYADGHGSDCQNGSDTAPVALRVSSSSSTSQSVGPAVGGVMAFLCVAGLAVVVVVFWRRRRSQHEEEKDGHSFENRCYEETAIPSGHSRVSNIEAVTREKHLEVYDISPPEEKDHQPIRQAPYAELKY